MTSQLFLARIIAGLKMRVKISWKEGENLGEYMSDSCCLSNHEIDFGICLGQLIEVSRRYTFYEVRAGG